MTKAERSRRFQLSSAEFHARLLREKAGVPVQIKPSFFEEEKTFDVVVDGDMKANNLPPETLMWYMAGFAAACCHFLKIDNLSTLLNKESVS